VRFEELQVSRVVARLGVNLILHARREQAEIVKELRQAPEVSPPLLRWAWCEAMVAAARRSPGLSFGPGLDLAEETVWLSERLAEGPFPAEAVADLQAQARMEWGNRLRLREDLTGAERELAAAARLLERGTDDPLLGARLCDLLGSLYRARRRFPEALDCLALAARLYRRCGEPHLAARVLVNRGFALIVAERPEEAIPVLDRALRQIDEQREPALMLAAVHNLLLALVDAGRVQEAFRALWGVRRLHKELGSRFDRLKLLGLEGQVAAALGQPQRAERLFRQAKAEYERRRLRFEAALESLHIAAALLDQGRPAGVLGLVDEALATFGALRIEREALAAVLLLREAVEQGEATAALARAAAKTMRYLKVREPRRRARERR
jgi:tetratricopeptide (TPR) repeat protein